MNLKLKHSIIFVFSLLLLAATLFFSPEIKNKENLEDVRFGYPLAFVSQNHLSYYSFYFFPTWDKFNFKDTKNTHNFSAINFLADLLIFFAAVEIVIWFLENLVFWAKKLFARFFDLW